MLKRYHIDEDEKLFFNLVLLLVIPGMLSLSVTLPLFTYIFDWGFEHLGSQLAKAGIAFFWLCILIYIVSSMHKVAFVILYLVTHFIIVGVFCWYIKDNFFYNVGVSSFISNLFFLYTKLLDQKLLKKIQTRQFDGWFDSKKEFFDDLDRIYKKWIYFSSLVILSIGAIIFFVLPDHKVISTLSVVGILLASAASIFDKNYDREMGKQFMETPIRRHSLTRKNKY